MLKTKKVVNNEYQFTRCLGEGLSSVVYEAERSNSSGISSEKVAVKVLKSENSVSWLQNEFESLKKVNSLNCVRVLGHEAFGKSPALVLEFVDGVTLFELGSRFKVNQSEINFLESQVIEGLRAISKCGLSHGDLNPKNILVNRQGIVKLIDFGAFRESSELIGTPAYMAENDFESWKLIRRDLERSFGTVGTHDELTIPQKVELILEQKLLSRQTMVISVKSERRNLLSTVYLTLLAAVLVLIPSQNLMSEPIKVADSMNSTSNILIRTNEWTDIEINGVSKGYAPLTLSHLPAGLYHVKYKRPRGSGEFTFFLNPEQKRVLRDADFKD